MKLNMRDFLYYWSLVSRYYMPEEQSVELSDRRLNSYDEDGI